MLENPSSAATQPLARNTPPPALPPLPSPPPERLIREIREPIPRPLPPAPPVTK